MNREEEILIQRATPLVFGIFGQAERPPDQREVRFGGSGIFIAPFQTLTARHVNRDLLRVNPERVDDFQRRIRNVEENDGRLYVDLAHSSALFQARFGRMPRPLIWHVRRCWDSLLTDVSFLEVNAEGNEAAGMEHQMAGFFEWSLLPPPVGARVITLGYPEARIVVHGGILNLDLRLVWQEGEVTDIYDLRRDAGMFKFPCFRINRPVNHGFSGAPVFWDGRLCGIVSGGPDDSTYVASLWPLCLLAYEYPDLGGLVQKQNFSCLFDSGVLRSPDWPHIRQRIEKRNDEHGRPYAYIAV